MYLKTDSLGHHEIMDGDIGEDQTAAAIIQKMKTGDPLAIKTFLKIAQAADRKQAVERDKAIPVEKKIDISLLGYGRDYR